MEKNNIFYDYNLQVWVENGICASRGAFCISDFDSLEGLVYTDILAVVNGY